MVKLQCRDVDAGQVWVREGKTRNSDRRVKAPAELWVLLDAHARRREAEGGPRALVFPHERDWVRRNTQRLCRLAGVPKITAHALRGMHATLATAAGATGDLVAAQLGHASPAITRAHYTSPEAVEHAKLRRVLEELMGSPEAVERALNAPIWSDQSPEMGQNPRNGFDPNRSAGTPDTKNAGREVPPEPTKPKTSNSLGECEGGTRTPTAVNH